MMTRNQIKAALERFCADPGRVISQELLCELAGIDPKTLRNIRTGAHDMAPTTQVRLERALKAIERGEVKIMERHDRTRYITYRRKPEPAVKRGLSLTMKDGRIAVRAAPVNPNCYTAPTFREELER